jgi:hypothetical protein
MENGWKEVFLTAHEYKATLAKDLLENEGLEVVVVNQHDTAIKSFGDYVIYVKESNEQKALQLLKELKH